MCVVSFRTSNLICCGVGYALVEEAVSISDYGLCMSLREGFCYKPLFFLKSVLPPLHSLVQSRLSQPAAMGVGAKAN